MSRIRGPGGNPPPPSKVPQSTGTGRSFEVAALQGTDAAREKQKETRERSELVQRMRDIARRRAKGEVTDKEAQRAFVSLVIDQRFPKLEDKGQVDGQNDEERRARLAESIAELIERDPVLNARIEAQFKRMSEKKG